MRFAYCTLRVSSIRWGGIVRGIGRAPHHAIDSEQLQPGPAGVIGLLVPACGGVVKQAFDALVAKLLASLQEGAGGDKGSLTGQQDIELIDQLIDYFVDLA